MNDSMKNKYRKLAEQGFGDDVIYDCSDDMWVVFRLPSFDIMVKSVSCYYEDVKVVKK